MKIKSSNETSLLRSLGWWLTGLCVLLIAGWAYSYLQSSTDSGFLSTTVSKAQSIKEIPKKSFRQIIETHKDQTILLSVKDESSKNFPDDYRSMMRGMGGEQLANIGFREGYTGIIHKGKFTEEKKSKSNTLSSTFKNYQTISAPISAGNYNLFVIDKDTIRRAARGLHTFIFDQDGVLTATYAFDFYENSEPLSTPIYINPIFEELPQFTIELSENKFQKFQRKRNQALKDGILITEDDDEVRASLRYNQQSYPINIRLKGDWTDHLMDDRWSFRIHLDTEDAIMGMQKFSLHHPKARNYLGEWLFHQVLEDQGLLGLKYDFVQLFLRVDGPSGTRNKYLGVYDLEEFFAKQLIERNERRAGLILKIDESLIWKNRVNVKGDPSVDYVFIAGIVDYSNLAILPFSEKSIRKDSTLFDQFVKARTLLKGYMIDSLSFSAVFDVQMMAKYNAVCNFFGANHAMVNHNLRFYYNPVTGRLEPVGFDANGLHEHVHSSYFDHTKKDLAFMTAYNEAMQSLLTDKYFDKLLNWPLLDEKAALMEAAFPGYKWEGEKILKINRQILKLTVDPISSLTVFLDDYDEKNFKLTVENYGELPIAIEGLTDEAGRNIGYLNNETTILRKEQATIIFQLDRNFQKLFVNKKKKKSGFSYINDLEKIKVAYRVLGNKNIKKQSILPWSNQPFKMVKEDLLRRPGNLSSFPFLVVDEINKTVTCEPGSWEIDQTLIIPEGYLFQINAGSTIYLSKPTAQIISFSPVKFVGTPDFPVRIFTEFYEGRGVLVMNTVDTSILKYCEFDKLKNPVDLNWAVSGAVNFYNAPVRITHTSFTNNHSEDALNIIKTDFVMEDVLFSGTQSDAFDGDFVKGEIKNVLFKKIGNDAIDISGSAITMDEIVIRGAGDKGLSAGEKSKMTGTNIAIYNSEIGVASKDDSEVSVTKILLEGNQLGFTAFQKKPEFGPASVTVTDAVLKNNSLDHLIENYSTLRLNGQIAPTVDRVKDQMYGVIYGKSSKQ